MNRVVHVFHTTLKFYFHRLKFFYKQENLNTKYLPRLVVIVLEKVNVYVYFVDTWNEIFEDSSSSSLLIDDAPFDGTESIRPSFIVREIFDEWSTKFSIHEADKSNETLYFTPRRSCKHALNKNQFINDNSRKIILLESYDQPRKCKLNASPRNNDEEVLFILSSNRDLKISSIERFWLETLRETKIITPDCQYEDFYRFECVDVRAIWTYFKFRWRKLG